MENNSRRGFMGKAFGAVAAVGAVGSLVAMKKTWDPLPSVKAAGFTTLDMSIYEEGLMVTEKWRGKPIFVLKKSVAIMGLIGLHFAALRIPHVNNQDGEEIEQWYTDFIINIYHKTVHGTIHMTPEERLYQGMLGVGDGTIPFLPTVPSDTLKLRMALLPASERTVQKNGITIDYITYFSETLRKWIIPAHYKKLNKNLKSNNVLCRRDPRDISKIYVYDPDIDNYIEVPYADIRRPAMNIKELRRSIAEAKKEVTGRELEQHDIFQAHNRLLEYAEKATREQKTVRRQKSSKKHMQKTIDYESKVLKSDIELNINKKEVIEDDEDGYEYYPVG
jgi:putative transposase